MSSHVWTLVRSEEVGVREGDRRADVEHVRRAARAAELLDGVDLSWLLPSGLSDVISMPYLALKPSSRAP
jgi:hypothetical protein